MRILAYLRHRMTENGQIFVLTESRKDLSELFDLTKLQEGDTVITGEDLHFKLCTVMSDEGNEFLAIYTNPQETYKDPAGNALFNQGIRDTLEAALTMENLTGIAFNPFGKHFVLTKEIISMLLEVDADERKCRNDKE